MRRKILPLLLCAVFLLTGCMANLPQERELISKDLNVREGPPAPLGDSQSGREATVELFVPDPNTLKLTVRVETVEIQSDKSRPEATIEALLRAINESPFYSYSGAQPLRLAQVSNAVETSGELVTVNLHTSAQLLREDALFALRVAITNTMTALPGINYVNVLIDGRDIGLNFEGTLPTGVLSSYPSGDVTTLWGQMNMQRNADRDTELQKMAALYYISEDGNSLLSQIRSVTFPERDMSEFVKLLLEEMTVPAREGLRIVVPPSEFFERDPVYDRPEGSSIGRIYIYLHEAIDDQLSTRGSTRAMLMASMCYTLTSFIPQLEGIYVFIGDELVRGMTLMNGNEWSSKDGLMLRSDFAPFVADMCTVYFPSAGGEALRAVTRPIPQRLKTQPRALLRELMTPPAFGSYAPALPSGTTDADVLGLMIDGDTALVNFSQAFADACRALPDDEVSVQRRNMIYAIVNTLTEIDGVTRVRFYFDGKQDTVGTQISTRGEFLRNPGLIR